MTPEGPWQIEVEPTLMAYIEECQRKRGPEAVIAKGFYHAMVHLEAAGINAGTVHTMRPHKMFGIHAGDDYRAYFDFAGKGVIAVGAHAPKKRGRLTTKEKKKLEARVQAWVAEVKRRNA